MKPQSLELVPHDKWAADKVPLSRWGRIRAFIATRTSMIICVLLPTLIAAFYLFFVAADRYEVESKFLIRSQSNPVTSELANLVSGSSIVRSADDAFAVQSYVSSPDIVKKLMDRVNLIELFGRPEADFAWRYPGLFSAHSLQRMRKYLDRIVNLEYEFSTGISTLRVMAFRPEDARSLSEAILREAELLINNLSDRAHQDAMNLAQSEVERNRQRAMSALQAVTDFRTRTGLIDPTKDTKAALAIMTRLSMSKSQANTELAELEQSSPQSVQIGALKQRINAIDAQLLAQRRQLAGDDKSIAEQLAEYERLSLEQEFAERAFASSLASLELARVELDRQRLFLARISTGVAPDHARYPYRFLNLLAVFAIAWMIHSIGRRIYFDTLSHAEK